MSGKDKWVRRFSVDETARHKNGFTIYKITSVLFPIDSPEAMTEVSVWKRYSEVQRLHRGMLALHAGLHLRGACPLPKSSYFRRFQKEVIEERAKAIKRFMEFIAEHRLLFISTEFVNFLQSGYPDPWPARAGSVEAIDAIRSALRLPPAEPPRLEYPADHSPRHAAARDQSNNGRDETDLSAIPQIPIHEPTNVELRQASRTTSFESITSMDSFSDDLYEELNKLTVERRTAVKKKLPDLISFDEPSCSRLEDYPRNSDASSMNSSVTFDSARSSAVSCSVSLSTAERTARADDGYVVEADRLLGAAARRELAGDRRRAFHLYKAGIEKMLLGVRTDTDPQRRALIKEKTNKYLSYAEEIYKNHLCGVDESIIPEPETETRRVLCPVPISMLARPYEELALYRVLAVIADRMMLVLHKGEQACYAMKVIQKIPNNLTEFDEYFLQRPNETRQPVLPTSIPYMVSLHAFVETNSLIFLILTYAPGEKLFDYIENYVKSAPTTPARELNLENVFSEPLKRDNVQVKISDSEEKHSEVDGDVSKGVDKVSEFEELVRNSQRLLQNVDRALNEAPPADARAELSDGIESPTHFKPPRAARGALPAAAARGWGAQLLAAVGSLHNAGVVCRDLNPSNILLGDGGRVLLTYRVGYPADVCGPRLSRRVSAGRPDMYAAPELYECLAAAGAECDYWSLGALLYRLLCGVPLSHYHRSVFTSHTILTLPDGLSLEEESLLTQLLTYDPAQRLGHNGIDEIKNHPYFKQIDWQSVYDSWALPG